MAAPYSLDLRERVVAAASAGQTFRQIAKVFSIAPSTVSNWAKRRRDTGSPAALPMGGKRPFSLAPQREWVLGRIAEKPDLTLAELRAELKERGVSVSGFAVWNFLRREGVSFKKSLRASEQDRADVARRRAQWQRYQGKIDANRLVFIDETGARTNMTRSRGRCLKNRRLVAKVPHGRWKSLTFIAALRADRVTAPCVIDAAVNARNFLSYVQQILIPTLRRGDVVIMDNLRSHKGKAIRAAIRAAGAKLLFLPPYSPDLNPIEQVFAKLKALLRKACESTVEATWRKIGESLDAFSAKECSNYLANSGYAAVSS